MYPNTTAGCADIEQVELSNGPELKCLDFDPSSDENEYKFFLNEFKIPCLLVSHNPSQLETLSITNEITIG